MGLTSRKEKILQAVIEGYIGNCEPVSSAEIKQKHLPALSTATIRNELAALEEMGYLIQPHTSAGRIPTADAYRLYVERFMPKRKLSRSELKIIKRYFSRKLTELDDILKCTAKVISEITNLTSVAYIQNTKDAVITNIKIVKLSPYKALLIIVTNLDVLKDSVINLNEDVSEKYCEAAADFFNNILKGHKINEVIKINWFVQQVKKDYEQLFKTIIDILKHYADDDSLNEIVLEGSAKILEQPEYSSLNKAKAMLEFLDAKEELIPILQNSDDINLNIKIGNDNEIRQGMPECAIVTLSYNINGINVGNAGVIGPIRMDYGKVISVLDYLSKTISILPALEQNNQASDGEYENNENDYYEGKD